MQRLLSAETASHTAAAKPRIMLVIGSLDCGGAQRAIAGMGNYWAAQGREVMLTTFSGPEVPDFYELHPAVKRAWLETRLTKPSPVAVLRASFSRIQKLRRLFQGWRPSAVISFIDVSNIYTLIAAIGLPVRVVASERTNPSINSTVSRPWRVLRRIVYWRASFVVAQTRDAADWVARHCRANVAVIPNALRPLPEYDRPREPLIVAIGRLTAEKGLDVLLRAFSRLCSRFPEWSVQIVGDGPERKALEDLTSSLNLSNSVHFAGEVRDVEEWLARAGLVVHSSRREGFPNAVLEAMGMGAAVICADCQSGPAELIQDGVNGRLVPVDDVDALVRVMSELIEAPETRERLGREALQVKERYHPDAIMGKWDACLEG